MAFKIGFAAETEQEDKRTFENVPIQKEPTIIKKSVVDVYFPDRDLTCSYYNDMFNLKRGDRSVFTNEELLEQWNYNRYNRPFIVKFLYAYSFPKLLNLKRLIELGVIKDVGSAPRGFTKITRDQFMKVIEETHTNENIIIS